MKKNKNTTGLIAGVDNLSLHIINFEPARDELEGICRFFSIGKLLNFEKEKGIIVTHSSFFVHLSTTHGNYALKFYPSDRARTITIAYAASLILVKHHFPTPLMYAGPGSEPFFKSKGLLVTCHAYIDGTPLWQKIKHPNTIRQTISAMLSLKDILPSTKGRIPFRKQNSLIETIKTLTRDSKNATARDQKAMIGRLLLDSCRTYKQHRSSFKRQWLHNNITLSNILIYKKTPCILDLEHVIEDYVLADLANLVISCLFFDIPLTTIKAIVKEYLAQDKITSNYLPVLNTLIKIKLIKEYQKYTKREKTIDLSAYPPPLARQYMFHLSRRTRSITAVLKRMSNDPNLFLD